MKTTIIIKYSLNFSILCGAMLTIGLSPTRAADQPASRGSREKAVLVAIEAKVESIDRAKREVALKGPLGNIATLTVDQCVKRFAEVKVGDIVRALLQYYA